MSTLLDIVLEVHLTKYSTAPKVAGRYIDTGNINKEY